MLIFDGNWFKLIFVAFSVGVLVVSTFVRIFESYTPDIALRLLRYGKLIDKKTNSLPSLRRLQVPKSYFKYFYVLAAWVYVPVALSQVAWAYLLDNDVPHYFMTLLNVCCGPHRIATISTARTLVAILLITLQIWRRFYDTHFVSVFSKKASMSVFHFFFGVIFYLGAILIILAESPKFANTKIGNEFRPNDLTLVDVTAVVIFLWAWYHQHVTTVILADIRKDSKGNIVTESYKLPQGDWFNYLSSPHYTSEIIMYTCLWEILGIRHGWWCVYALVLTNQVDSLISSHQWYQQNFKNFPKKRKALIPFII
jgi:3-oxo-5-alpha-steroid 4-dehydrogenase 3